MNENDVTTVALSKIKLFFLIAGAIAFVALGTWMFQMSPEEIMAQEKYNNPTLIHGIGLTSILFFGLCGVLGFRKLFDKKPGLTLNSAGIHINSSGVSPVFIAWADIAGFSAYMLNGQKLLAVVLFDPEKFMANSTTLKRALYKSSYKMCGSPVSISSNALKISFDELQHMCAHYLAKYGNFG